MQIDEIFLTDTTKKSKVWIEVIKKFGDSNDLIELNTLDINTWSLVEKERDKLSYYHGEKRARVHLGNCYQELVIQLLIKTLEKKGVHSSLVSYLVKGSDSELLLNGKELEDIIQVEELLEKRQCQPIKAVYKNDIFAIAS